MMYQKVIDGKIYDTEKAELIHEWENGDSLGDIHYLEEKLYRTPRGAYFLVGEGGAATAYAQRIEGNSWADGGDICALTEAEAISWLEEHGGTEALMENFPEALEEA